MIARFTLSTRGGDVVYRGSVGQSDTVYLELANGRHTGLHYASVHACYTALCGRRDGYLWRTVGQAGYVP